MDKITLISTFYSFEPFVVAAHKFAPTTIVLIVGEDSLRKIPDKIEKVKEVYAKVATIEIVPVDGGDLLCITSKTIEIIENNQNPIVNVTGGGKLLAQGVLYGCYARRNLIQKIVCNNIEDSSIVELPKLDLGVSSIKKEVLKEIEQRNSRSILEIAKSLDKKREGIYQHLKELKEIGYVDEKFQITLAGRLALL